MNEPDQPNEPVEPQPAQPSLLPSLSEHQSYRPQAKAVNPGQPVVATPAGSSTSVAAKMRRRRRIRARIRKAVVLVVLLGLLGGGAYAAKYYFLDTRWPDGYDTLVSEVEQARGITFDEPVEVKELDAAEYAATLFHSTMKVEEAGEAELAGAWRALGVLTGPLDATALGLTAAAEAPAFYDAAASTIYVIRDLPTDLHRFAVQRALAAALLDQEFGWGDRIEGSSSAVARGTAALYDADALAIADSLLDTDERVAVLAQQRTLATAFDVTTSTSPFATTLMGRSGLALRSYVQTLDIPDRTALELSASPLDGQVLDLRRLVKAIGAGATLQPDVEAGPDAEGTLFWYHAFSAHLDAESAWQLALALHSDNASVVSGTAGVCVTALLRFDATTTDATGVALATWAAGAPAESSTSVAPVAGGQPGEFQISACDPSDALDTGAATLRPSLGGAPLRSEQYRVLHEARPELSAARIACAVFGVDPISAADDRNLVDGLDGWSVSSLHSPPDPDRADCATL